MGKVSKEEKKRLKQQQKEAKAAAKRAKKQGTAWADIPSTSVGGTFNAPSTPHGHVTPSVNPNNVAIEREEDEDSYNLKVRRSGMKKGVA